MQRVLNLAAAIAAATCVIAPLVADEPATRAEKIKLERKEKAESLTPEEPTGLEKQLLIVKERQILQRFGQGAEGLFPKVGGLQSGQGFALGVQYTKSDLAGGALKLRSSGTISTRRSQRYELGLNAPALYGGLLELDVGGVHRNLAAVDYYGPGPDSSLDNRTSFRHEHLSFDGKARARPFRDWLVLGGGVGYSRINIGPGQRSGVPSTEELFTPLQTAGLDVQTNFLRTSALFAVDYRDPTPSGARSGGLYSFELTHFEDVDLQRHDFERLDIELQQFFGFFNKKRVVMLRGRTSLSLLESGQSVPFYWQPFLGGPRELRGFRNYRFYGNHALVMNVEYRWEAFSGLDMALFFDAGKVAMRKAELDFTDLETNAGFGFRFNGRNSIFLRLDFAFSHEAARIWFRFGSPFEGR